MNQIEVVSSLESLGNIRINKKTSVEDLVAFAVKAETIFRLNDTDNCILRFRQGKSLAAAKLLFKGKGGWRRYIESQGISAMSDNRARRLAKEAKSEKALAGLTLSEAYRKFLTPQGPPKPPREKRAKDAVPTPPRTRIEPREEELAALYQFLSVVGSWERARDLLEAGEALLESPEKREPSPETREEATV